MAPPTYPPLNITAHWAAVSDHLIELVDAIPDDKLDWSPTPEQWNFRGLFVHIAGARHHWLANAVHDREDTPDLIAGCQTKEGLKEQLRLSWERLERFLSDAEKLAAVYEPPDGDPEYLDPALFDGHFIAYHRLVHDIHHRADIMQRLALLGIEISGTEVPAGRRRRPL